MTDSLIELSQSITIAQEEAVIDVSVLRDELTVTVSPSAIGEFVTFLKNDANCQFTTLIDITAVDFPERERRFEVVYHFLSMTQNQRIRLKLPVREGEIVPSISEVHPSANWFEREVFDMYGIMFSGHPDLRRLLTDYGFRGHPLRKDFPTTGYVEVRYDEAEKRVIYEPVELVQEYRQFDFMSPWEGAEYILPGDEQAAKG
ncbi:NADH-quinone oxidoreductase subunit C [Algicella marina]|uniref:NADH-quinone oxidoreductase subunit C n=1 Tax=Algicella marina TaxID=2683284 RepID=A0A6P1SV87_9RHOB|nr:NADH-quinone oxidoreductase subunit C [Algicella marina]QHQ34604.1 NADH-quinone oxidoreductase subunit C [Algicella marina]